MSKIRIIQFDASIRNGKVGIGMFDRTSNVSIVKSVDYHDNINMSSKDAETLALICTLQYMNENNIKSARLFTDNSQIADRGISDYLKKKYLTESDVSLHWLPRELNSKADTLSKKGSYISHIVESFNTKEKIKKYPLLKRLNLLERLAKAESDYKVLDKIRSNKPLNKSSKKFLKICLSIISPGEIKTVDKYLNTLTKTQRRSSRLKSPELEDTIFKRIYID